MTTNNKELIGQSMPLPSESNGPPMEYFFVPKESLFDPRKEQRIKWWRTAPEKVITYRSGIVKDNDGNFLYRYEGGSRLLIGDETKGEAIQVMDKCEIPWAEATVNRAFEELGSKSGQVDVLERGFGMGLTAKRVIENLVPRGGSYTVIELNEGDADHARRVWKPTQERSLRGIGRGRGMRSTQLNIAIEIVEGEAYEETRKLAEAGKKFDLIISDTYPLTEDEQGMNDLQDLDTLKHCLEPNGIFTFFAYFPESTEDVAYKQINIITRHFRDYTVSRVSVNPPPDYKYLQTTTGPVRSLPVIICKNPIL